MMATLAEGIRLPAGIAAFVLSSLPPAIRLACMRIEGSLMPPVLMGAWDGSGFQDARLYGCEVVFVWSRGCVNACRA